MTTRHGTDASGPIGQWLWSLAIMAGTVFAAPAAPSDPPQDSPRACAAHLEVVPLHAVIETPFTDSVESKQLHVLIRNVGSEPLVLVQPGDGSEKGLRTPW